MSEIKHPRSEAVVSGERLAVGTELQEGDVYDSLSGKWAECPCVGLKISMTDVVWVRPVENQKSE